ncbi:MAG: hypothetical protein AAGF25_14075 [Pseudomonadota bacterium]
MNLASAPNSSTAADRSFLVRALPPFGALILPTAFWALACFVAGIFALVFARGWVLAPQSLYVGSIYGLGAMLSVWPSVYLTRMFIRRRSAWRIVFLMLFLLVFTLFITASIFALEYRLYFTQWHGEPFSKIWIWQQAFTSGAAVYTYIVLGLRLYIPAAVIALIVTSWWLNRLPD